MQRSGRAGETAREFFLDGFARRGTRSLVVVIGALMLAACGTTTTRAPVVDRGVGGPAPTLDTAVAAALPGAENAGKPGYYTVERGDNLRRVAARYGRSVRELAAWNDISNPDVIEVGQVLRVVPPEGAVPAAGMSPAPTTTPPVATQTTPGTAPAPASESPTPSSAAAASSRFIWPAQGSVIARFNGNSSKGIDIAGKKGDPVVAAAGGRVIYVGSGVRGYGNLVIIKHDDTFLTAYAHNDKLLVKEDQDVKQGQQIATMGQSDADKVMLHFEVRRSGKPVDPLDYLPKQ